MPFLHRLVFTALFVLFAGTSTGIAQEAGIAPPADDETLIYVIREGRFAGSMNKMWVAVNDKTVGRVENDAYAVVRAKAGRITLNLATAGIVAGAFAVDDGFVIALPYGQSADWVKNVLASNSAVIVDEGGTYRVGEPEIVETAEVVQHLPSGEQRMLRLFGVGESLRFGRVEADV